MNLPEVEIKLLRAPDDLPGHDPAYQAEIRFFAAALRAGDVTYSQRAMAFDSVDGGGYQLAEFIISNCGSAALGVIAGAAKEWFKGRAARKVQAQIGDIKVQASTVPEVLQLLDKAAEIKRNRIKTKKKQ